MSRIPLRIRLTLAFTVAMAIVLALVGSLLYVRLGSSLREQIDDGLEARTEMLGQLLFERGLALTSLELSSSDEEFVQVLDADGLSFLASEPRTGVVAGPDDVERAREGRFYRDAPVVPGLGSGPARLLISQAAVDSRPVTLVVGASLEDRQEALDGLRAQLFVVAPLALLLTALGGYLLAGAALRPVDEMRRQAAEISSDEAGRRLRLPAADDELRRLGQTLNDMLGRLEAGLARERRFVADASHELRTPLAALRTELELALRRPRSQEELEAALGSAAEEVERVVGLAENLLVLARADEGNLPLDTSNHVVRELLDAVAGRYDAQAAALGRTIQVEGPSDRALSGDRLRLEQALGNLVDNALRYGGGTVRIDAVADDGVVELRVSDDGEGFPVEFLPHAFERFSRADVARAEGGAGLGLAIVDAIARAHDGVATATNLPSGGASISLRLPRLIPLSSDPPTVGESRTEA